MMVDHRVNRLKLTAENEADIQKASLLIEDAIHTASFPGLPKNGLVLIRRLELGKIRMTNNSSIFSQRIDQHFLSLQPQVIKWGREELPEASVVWFADTIEPYILLSRLLAKNKVPVSWYWRLAVRDWKQSNNTRHDLVQLIVSASQTAYGLMAVAAIVDGLVTDKTIDHLITSISVDTTRLILQNIHIDQNNLLSINTDNKRPTLKPVSLTDHWQSSLQKWLPELGEGDSRSCLLAISAAMSYDYTTAEFIAADILQHVVEYHYQNDCDANDKEQNDYKINAKCSGFTKSGFTKYDVTDKEQLLTNANVVKDDFVDVQNLNDKQQEIFFENNTVDILSPSGLVSQNSGLPMLINVLQRLQIHETLTRYPLLAELNLPNHILWACGHRAGVKSNDIICQWLTEKYKLPTTLQHCPFVIPESWFQLLFNRHRSEIVVLRCINTDKKKHLLCDTTGKVVLAIWQGKMPSPVKKIIKGRKIKLLAQVPVVNDFQLIISTYLFAIKRYLWRFSKKGIRTVVGQSGRVAITRNHLDISFTMQQIDIDIRRAGLDIDPGWVPCLGRVIQFHYLDDEY